MSRREVKSGLAERSSKRLPMSALTTAAVLLALMAQAQTPAPKFRTTTRLVELSVSALDRRGQPVTDLKLEDFTIEEGGSPPHLDLQIRGRAVNRAERLAAPRRPFSPTAWNSRQWKPAPDAVSVRIIVRDMTTGRYGTLDVPLKKLPAARK